MKHGDFKNLKKSSDFYLEGILWPLQIEASEPLIGGDLEKPDPLDLNLTLDKIFDSKVGDRLT